MRIANDPGNDLIFSVAVKDLFDLFGFSVFLYLPFVRFHFLHRPVIMTAGIADKIAADTAGLRPTDKMYW